MRQPGIEPGLEAWEAPVLPLDYYRTGLFCFMILLHVEDKYIPFVHGAGSEFLKTVVVHSTSTSPVPIPEGKTIRSSPTTHSGIVHHKGSILSMKFSNLLFIAVIVVSIFFCISPVLADTDANQKVIYQETFSSDPHWQTKNPSSDYWDPNKGAYHFGIEPSTGNYAFIPVNYDGGAFTLQYDLTLMQVDPGATFRLGFSGTEMDRGKGPNVITEFTNAKYGNLLSLRLVTQNANLLEVSSAADSYNGPTINYELNKTYHVVVIYDDASNTVTERVSDKLTGRTIWSYYLNTLTPLKNMNRIYVGSIGDYSPMYHYAVGYIDSILLTQPSPVTPGQTTAAVLTSTVPTYSLHPTTQQTTRIPLTSIPTPTQSPVSGFIPGAALAVLGSVAIIQRMKKNK